MALHKKQNFNLKFTQNGHGVDELIRKGKNIIYKLLCSLLKCDMTTRKLSILCNEITMLRISENSENKKFHTNRFTFQSPTHYLKTTKYFTLLPKIKNNTFPTLPV